MAEFKMKARAVFFSIFLFQPKFFVRPSILRFFFCFFFLSLMSSYSFFLRPVLYVKFFFMDRGYKRCTENRSVYFSVYLLVLYLTSCVCLSVNQSVCFEDVCQYIVLELRVFAFV